MPPTNPSSPSPIDPAQPPMPAEPAMSGPLPGQTVHPVGQTPPVTAAPPTTHVPAAETSPPPAQPVAPQLAPQPAQPINPASQDEGPDESPHTFRRILGFILSWILIPGLLVLFVHNFVFQAWYVDGQSMHSSFENGDYLIVSKWDVSLKKLTGQSNKLDIKRGDVVIFNPPSYTSDIYFIKRAIGLPGERIVIKDGTIHIFNQSHPQGFQLNETYINNIPLEGDIDQTVPEGQLFVIGDNRNPGASHDSRAIGPIPQDHIIGTADIRLLPVSQFGVLPHPTY